jgi:hypothetical protein
MNLDLHELRDRLRREGSLGLAVRVIPKSARTEWAGMLADGSWKVKLRAVPEKGRANEELIRFLAEEFGVARTRVEIVAGLTNPHKQIRVRG